MEKAKSISNINIPCPNHPFMNIQRVRLDTFAEKNIYCFECLLQDENAHTLYKNTPTIENFIALAAAQFSVDKEKAKPSPSPPKKYQDVGARKGEALEKLTKHFEDEKNKILDFFDELKKTLPEVLERTKQAYLKVFEEQITNLYNNYAEFEKELEMGYPTQTDIESWFPKQVDLEKRLAEIKSVLELNKFIQDIKMKLHHNKNQVTIGRQPEKARTQYFDEFVENIKKMELKRPYIDLKSINMEKIKSDFQYAMKGLLESLTIMDPIQPISSFTSSIASHRDFSFIKGWLPPQFVNTDFELLYRASRDGPMPEAFHKLCDGKGPTVTLIKCKFNGAIENAVIGGFLDKDWHKKNAAIFSQEAFLFSLTACIKCPCIQPQNAVNGYADSGPNFGAGNDLRIASILTQCYINPKSYQNSGRLVNSDYYDGKGQIFFTPLDIEVYRVK